MPIFPATDLRGARLLSHSRMQAAKVCRRLYKYRYVDGLRSVHTATALRMGRAFHDALDLLSKPPSPAEAESGSPRERVWSHVINAYRSGPAPETAEAELDREVEAHTLAALAMAYSWRWEADTLKVVASEIELRVPLADGAAFDAGGKIDRIVQLEDGRLAILETKTTSDDIGPNSDYWARLRMDTQLSHYVLLARAAGYDIQTIIYDVIRKPGIRPKKIEAKHAKQIKETGQYFGVSVTDFSVERETPEMFAARLLDDATTRPEFYFARQEVTRLASDLEEYGAELEMQSEDLAEMEAKGHYFRNTSACLFPSRCAFFNLCVGRWKSGEPIPSGFEVGPTLHPELEPKPEVQSSKEAVA